MKKKILATILSLTALIPYSSALADANFYNFGAPSGGVVLGDVSFVQKNPNFASNVTISGFLVHLGYSTTWGLPATINFMVATANESRSWSVNAPANLPMVKDTGAAGMGAYVFELPIGLNVTTTQNISFSMSTPGNNLETEGNTNGSYTLFISMATGNATIAGPPFVPTPVPNVDPGNSTGDQGIFLPCVVDTSITRTTARVGINLYSYGAFYASENFSLNYWTTDNRSDLKQILATGLNPVTPFLNFSSSPYKTWYYDLTGLTQNTTYHLQVTMRGDGNSANYTSSECKPFTTLTINQGNPNPGPATDTGTFPGNLLGTNPGVWWITCFVTMIFAYAICSANRIMSVAAPLVVLAIFVVINPSVFGWLILLGALLVGLGVLKAFNNATGGQPT